VEELFEIVGILLVQLSVVNDLNEFLQLFCLFQVIFQLLRRLVLFNRIVRLVEPIESSDDVLIDRFVLSLADRDMIGELFGQKLSNIIILIDFFYQIELAYLIVAVGDLLIDVLQKSLNFLVEFGLEVHVDVIIDILII
jgi:hypothetical protein